MKIKCKKIKIATDAENPNNFAPIGAEYEGEFNGFPVVGECFFCGNLRTSRVTEIISHNIFKTMNSYYEFVLFNSDNSQPLPVPEAKCLDATIEIQKELLRQAKRAGLDDQQTDLINENIISKCEEVLKPLFNDKNKASVSVTLLLTLTSKADWIRKCPSCLPDKERFEEKFLFVDKEGNVLENGGDFMDAQDLGLYPVKVYRIRTTSQYRKLLNENGIQKKIS